MASFAYRFKGMRGPTGNKIDFKEGIKNKKKGKDGKTRDAEKITKDNIGDDENAFYSVFAEEMERKVDISNSPDVDLGNLLRRRRFLDEEDKDALPDKITKHAKPRTTPARSAREAFKRINRARIVMALGTIRM